MIALFVAAESGDAKKVGELLAQIPREEIAATDYRDRTALHLAIERGHLDVVDVLIGFDDLAAQDGGGFTALHLAAELGHDKIVKRLLEKRPQLVCEMTRTGLTCLHLAVIRGHATIVRQLLTTNPELVNVQTSRAKSALYFAVEYGHQEIVNMLVESVKKNLNFAKMMCFHAIKFGYVAIASQLLVQNPELMDIANFGRDDLLVSGVDMELRGKSVLHLAAEYGRDTIVSQLLVEKPDLIEASCRSTRNLAAGNGYEQATEVMGVEEPLLLSDFERSPGVLHLAAENGHEKVVAQLLAAKPALASQIDSQRHTALHIAAKHCNEKVVALLLSHNPELIDAEDLFGKTPLHLAVEFDSGCCGKTVACLLAHKPAQVDETMLWSALKQAKGVSNDEAIVSLLQYKPELVFAQSTDGYSNNTVLHHVFGSRGLFDGNLFSEELMVRVWQMIPEALHQTNCVDETPFHIAIRRNNQFTIELVQDKLSLDEIMEAFATCGKTCPRSIMDKLHNCLLGSLDKDVVGIISAYLNPSMGEQSDEGGYRFFGWEKSDGKHRESETDPQEIQFDWNFGEVGWD